MNRYFILSNDFFSVTICAILLCTMASDTIVGTNTSESNYKGGKAFIGLSLYFLNSVILLAVVEQSIMAEAYSLVHEELKKNFLNFIDLLYRIFFAGCSITC